MARDHYEASIRLMEDVHARVSVTISGWTRYKRKVDRASKSLTGGEYYRQVLEEIKGYAQVEMMESYTAGRDELSERTRPSRFSGAFATAYSIETSPAGRRIIFESRSPYSGAMEELGVPPPGGVTQQDIDTVTDWISKRKRSIKSNPAATMAMKRERNMRQKAIQGGPEMAQLSSQLSPTANALLNWSRQKLGATSLYRFRGLLKDRMAAGQQPRNFTRQLIDPAFPSGQRIQIMVGHVMEARFREIWERS